MITSTKNPKIQWVRALQARARSRREEHAYVIEGVRLAEEALAAGLAPALVLHTADLSERGQAVVAKFAARRSPVLLVAEQVMLAAADTQTPQGLLAILSIQPPDIPSALDFSLVVDGVRDPGNLGTILRTAAAAGVQAVFLPPGTVDPYSPKVVRAAMGAHFRLPIAALDWKGIRGHLAPSGAAAAVRVFLAAADMGLPYTSADFTRPLALILGGEAAGAGKDARALTHDRIYIPMPGGGESLNVSMAAGILLFEIIRQRGAGVNTA
jgi:TrmH family RNA methyltransferase